MNRPLLFGICALLALVPAYAVTYQALGQDTANAWRIGGGTQSCLSTVRLNTQSYVATMVSPPLTRDVWWPGTCAAAAAVPYRWDYTSTIQVLGPAVGGGTPVARPTRFKTFVDWRAIVAPAASPCPSGNCNPTYGLVDAVDLDAPVISNDFTTTTVTIGGVQRKVLKLVTIGWYGDSFGLTIGKTGESTAYIDGIDFQASGNGDGVPSCGGPTKLCYDDAIAGSTDPSQGRPPENFFTISQSPNVYSLPLQYKCAAYAIQATRASHNDWGPVDAQPKLMNYYSGGTPHTWSYGRTFVGGDNTMNAVVRLDASEKAYQIAASGLDGSSNAGGQQFDILCVDPDVPPPASFTDGVCNPASVPSENACNDPGECVCVPRGATIGLAATPPACTATATGPNQCCTSGDYKTSSPPPGGLAGYCCPGGWYYSSFASACLPPPNDGFCDTVNGENPVNSPADCPTGVVCPYGMHAVGVTCIADQTCGDPATTGKGCTTDVSTPPLAGYYCSDGINVDDSDATTGTCCPSGSVWTGASCITTQECRAAATCPVAAPVSPPSPPSSYYTTNSCVGPTANLGTPGACCSVGTKYGIPGYYDYTNSVGSGVNNFKIY